MSGLAERLKEEYRRLSSARDKILESKKNLLDLDFANRLSVVAMGLDGELNNLKGKIIIQERIEDLGRGSNTNRSNKE